MEQGSRDNKPRQFAVFDIDGTVIRWQLYHAIAGQLAKQNKLHPNAYETIQAARLTWKQRQHQDSFEAYEQVLVTTYLDAIKDLSVADYNQTVDIVFQKYKDQVYTYTRDLIRELTAKDYLLFAISGSQSEIVAKLATYYGFDDHRGAEFEQVDGRFTGKVSTPYGRKLELLKEMMAAHGVSTKGSIGIGDAGTDTVILETVERPIAFNPNKALYEAARQNHWPIVIERKNVIYQLNADGQAYQLIS